MYIKSLIGCICYSINCFLIKLQKGLKVNLPGC
jgi:hypothetical protein